MKSISTLFFLLLISSARLFSQNIEDLDAFEKAMKPGVHIIYDYDKDGKSCKLELVIKKLSPELVIDWQMSDPMNQKGSITMSANALSKGDAFFFPSAGGDSKLETETAFWLSAKTIDAAHTTQEASVKMKGNTDSIAKLQNTVAEGNFNLNGALVAVPAMELQDPGSKFTFTALESTKFPLIYSINAGYTLVLSEIKMP